MPVKTINYKAKEIVYVDHRGLSGEAMLNSIKDACNYIIKKGSKVLMLADYRDCAISNEITKYLQSEEMKQCTKCISKQAILGIAGIKKMVYSLYNAVTGSGAKLFDDENAAKDYLVQ